MKPKLSCPKTALIVFFTALLAVSAVAAPLGTAMTYQGRLNDSANPATGLYELRFRLFDDVAAGALTGTPNTVALAPVGVTNGLFTVNLDFGGTAFSGSARWLEIGVRTNGSSGDFTTLTPRQPITPTPYALFASKAAMLDENASQSFTGTIGFNPSTPGAPPFAVGSAVKVNNLNADLFDGLDSTNFLLKSEQCLTNLAELKARDAGFAPCVTVLGYYAPGDGGGGDFYWDASTVEPDNGGTVISPGATSPVGRWKRVREGTLSVRWFGAKGDSTSLDTLAIQGALDALSSGGGTVVFPAGTYVCGTLNVLSKVDSQILGPGKIKWSGTGTPHLRIGLSLAGTCTNLRIVGLNFEGNGVASDYHSGIWTASDAILTDILIANCRIEDTSLGIGIGSAFASQVQGVVIENNHIKNIVGTESGTGYGINNSGGTQVRILNNHIEGAQRHSIYQSVGSKVIINGNIIKDHRITVAEGSLRGACVVARSQDVDVNGNVFDNCFDGTVDIEPDDGINQHVQNINVVGNVFKNCHLPAVVWIGSLSPTNSGVKECSDVLVANNTFWSSGIDTIAVRVAQGKRVRVRENHAVALSIPANITLFAYMFEVRGETAGTATYSQDMEFENNTCYGELISGGSLSTLRIDSLAAISGVRMRYFGNRALAGRTFSTGTDILNPNIAVGNQTTDGLTFLAGVAAQPSEFRGLAVKGNATDANELLLLQNTAANGHRWRIGEQDAAGQLSFRDLDAPGVPTVFALRPSPSESEVGLLVRRNIGGVLSLVPVTMGDAGSAGPGFRVLRVPD